MLVQLLVDSTRQLESWPEMRSRASARDNPLPFTERRTKARNGEIICARVSTKARIGSEYRTIIPLPILIRVSLSLGSSSSSFLASTSQCCTFELNVIITKVRNQVVDFALCHGKEGSSAIKRMVLTNFSGNGVGFGFGIGCGFGVGWGFGGMPLNILGLGVGGGCGVGLGLGWGFGTAFGSQYRTAKVIFQGIDFDSKGGSDGKTLKDLSKNNHEVRASE